MRLARNLVLAAVLAATGVPALAQPTEASLRAADAEQMRIIVDGDAAAQQTFMHPNYIINGPANDVKRKGQVAGMLAQGGMASQRFERTIEGVALTGDVGVIMGRETVTPAPGSELARLHPGKTLSRRFTNVFLWDQGRWWFLARQATVVAP